MDKEPFSESNKKTTNDDQQADNRITLGLALYTTAVGLAALKRNLSEYVRSLRLWSAFYYFDFVRICRTTNRQRIEASGVWVSYIIVKECGAKAAQLNCYSDRTAGSSSVSLLNLHGASI